MKLETLKKQELINIILRKDEVEKESSEELRKMREAIKDLQGKLDIAEKDALAAHKAYEAAKKDCLGTEQALESTKNNLNDLRDEYDAMTDTAVSLSNRLTHSHFLNIVLGISFITALICAVFC